MKNEDTEQYFKSLFPAMRTVIGKYQVSDEKSVSKLSYEQQLAVDAALRGESFLLLGLPGSGKTFTLAKIAQILAIQVQEKRQKYRATSYYPVLVLAPTRERAEDIKLQVAMLLGGINSAVQVFTPAGLARYILQEMAKASAQLKLNENSINTNYIPMPNMVSGPEYDAKLKDLLILPDFKPQSKLFKTIDYTQIEFRNELRNLFTRIFELGMQSSHLRLLSAHASFESWEDVAFLLERYEHNIQAENYANIDHAAMLDRAVWAINHYEEIIKSFKFPPPIFSTILIDDYQDFTVGGVRLVSALARAPQTQAKVANIILSGNSDTASQGFRTGVTELLDYARKPVTFNKTNLIIPELGNLGVVKQCLLTQRFRGTDELHNVYDTLVQAIPAGVMTKNRQVPQNKPQLGRDIEIKVSRSRAQECLVLAGLLRDINLRKGVSWDKMAVITRSAQTAEFYRRELSALGVSVNTPVTPTLIRERRAVRPLIAAARLVLSGPNLVDILEVTNSYLIDIPNNKDVVVREVRAYLDRIQTKSEKLEWPWLAPDLVNTDVFNPIRDVIQAGSTALQKKDEACAVIWAMWEASGKAEQWRAQALETGLHALEADENLDDMLALFESAQDCQNKGICTLGDFIEFQQRQEVPQDSIALKGRLDARVDVLTVTASVGKSWDYVVLAGMENETWPNSKVRDALLATNHLVQVSLGKEVFGKQIAQADRRREVITDELRLLALAVSRANKKIFISAVEDKSSTLSYFITRLFDLETFDFVNTNNLHNQNWSDLIANLRIVGQNSQLDEQLRAESAKLLGYAAKENILAANPITWRGTAVPTTYSSELDCLEAVMAYANPGQLDASSEFAILDKKETIRLSPSSLARVLECPLRYKWEKIDVSFSTSVGAKLGTVLHIVFKLMSETPLERVIKYSDSFLYEKVYTYLNEAQVEIDSDAEAENLEKIIKTVLRAMKIYFAKIALQEARAEVPGSFVVRNTAGEDIAEIRGIADRIEGNPPKRIVDLKTGKKPTPSKAAKAEIQMFLYQLMFIENPYAATVEQGKNIYYSPSDSETCIIEDYQQMVREINQNIDKLSIEKDAWCSAIFYASASESRSPRMDTFFIPQPILDAKTYEQIMHKIKLAIKLARYPVIIANASQAQVCANCTVRMLCPSTSEGEKLWL